MRGDERRDEEEMGEMNMPNNDERIPMLNVTCD